MPDGMTLLDCWSRSEEVRELLIAKATNVADVNARYSENRTLLHYAADLSRKDAAERLIAKGADVNARDNEGNTPLHCGLSKEVAELLIAKGADVNARDNEGNTVLHCGLSKEVAELLIAKGVYINTKNNQGQTPLDTKFQWESWSWLTSDPTNNRIEVIELLIAKGAQLNINIRFSSEETSLHIAAGLGRKDIVELLIAKGANINAKDDGGLTPLDWATIKSHANIVELLKSRGGIGSCRNLDELQVVCKGNPINISNGYAPTSQYYKYYIRYKNSSKICARVQAGADYYPRFLKERFPEGCN
jgi:ankyrin repeat protein